MQAPTINIEHLHINQINNGDNQSHTSILEKPLYAIRDCANCNEACLNNANYISMLREEIVLLKQDYFSLQAKYYELLHNRGNGK